MKFQFPREYADSLIINTLEFADFVNRKHTTLTADKLNIHSVIVTVLYYTIFCGTSVALLSNLRHR